MSRRISLQSLQSLHLPSPRSPTFQANKPKSKFFIEKAKAPKRRISIVQKYDIKKTFFNPLELEDLTHEFNRLSDMCPKLKIKLISKDTFLKFFLNCQDVTTNEGLMAKFITDSLFNLYDIEKKDGLELSGMMNYFYLL